MLTEQQVWRSDSEILGGTPVFTGTRVPVRSLFDYLEGGESLEEFLRQFPSVRRDQAISAIDMARDSLLAGTHSTFEEHTQNGAVVRTGNPRVSGQFGGAHGALCA